MSFQRAYEKTASFEGGWSDHEYDAGGQTKFGVTKFLANRYGEQISKLTQERAQQIFKEEFWDKMHLERLENCILVQHYMFDWLVNSGPKAMKRLQLAVFVKQDGVLGPVTRDAVERQDQNELLRKLMLLRMKDAISYCERDERQLAFIRGWALRFFSNSWTAP